MMKLQYNQKHQAYILLPLAYQINSTNYTLGLLEQDHDHDSGTLSLHASGSLGLYLS